MPLLLLMIHVTTLLTGASAEALSIRTVALGGQPAPGTDGAVFESFYNPSLNAGGEVAFGAFLVSGDVTTSNNVGIWQFDAAGTVRIVARSGDSTSEVYRGKIGDLGPFPALNDRSQVAFRSSDRRVGGGFYADNFWVAELGAEPVLFAREHTEADGLPPDVLIDDFEFADFRFSNAGVPVFEATTFGRSTSIPSSRAVFGPGSGDRSSAIALLGDAVDGGTIRSFDRRNQFVNAAGQVVLGANLEGASSETRAALLLSEPGGGLETRVMEGGEAPNIPGAIFEHEFFIPFHSYRVNETGQVAVAAYVKLDTSYDGGVWVLDPGGDGRLVARNGDVVPGTTSDSPLALLESAKITFNDEGQVSLLGEVESSDSSYRPFRSAIFGPDTGGGVALIALQGGPAVGFPEGATYGSFDIPILNDRGEVAFISSLNGVGFDPGAGSATAIYFADASGGIQLVAGSGSELEVAPGDVRTVVRVNLWNGDFAARGHSSFNDSSQLAFVAVFDDGSSGVFLATPVPVPADEQAAALLAFSIEAMEDGSLRGEGPSQSSATRRLAVFRRNLEVLVEEIVGGRDAGACSKLLTVVSLSDGLPSPPDFVTGEGLSVFSERAEELVASLGCTKLN